MGVFAPNGLSAYISDESNGKIYSFEYILGTDNIFRYPALFAMMVRNFQLVSVATAQGASAQSTLKPATSTQSSKIVPTSTIENPAEQNNDATSTNPVS